MCTEYDPATVVARLNSMVGQKHEPPDGCLKFLKRALAEFGIEIEGTSEATKRDARKFKPVDKPSLGTVVIFKNVENLDEQAPFHVALMLDTRWAIQSSRATYGVGRIEITRYPWVSKRKGFYRPKMLGD